MLKWLINKVVTEVHSAKKQIAEKEKQSEATELGKDIADQTFAAVEDYAKARFPQLEENYLKVLKDGIEETVGQSDYPHLTAARDEYGIFLENVASAETEMKQEFRDVLAEWYSISIQMEVEDEFDRLVDHFVSDMGTSLRLKGLNCLVERADELKQLDDEWRRLNPEKAKDYPEEETQG